jgi:flagellar biogenesis protein FliO
MRKREASVPAVRLTATTGILLTLLIPQPVAAQLSTDEGRTAPLSTLASEPVRHSETAVVERPARAAASAIQTRSAGRSSRAEESDPESRPLKAYKTPRSEPPVEGGSLFLSVLGKLAFVVALMLACAVGWKKLQGGMPQNAAMTSQGVQLVSALPLGAQRCLHLVAVGRQQLLIASTPQNISLLATLDGAGTFEVELERPGAPMFRRPPPAPAAGGDTGWQESGFPAEDRFEELLLRLRRLETEQAGRVAARGEGMTEGRYHAPVTEPPASHHLAAVGPRRAGGDSASRPEVGRAGGSVVPGSLFHTSPDGTRAGRDA